MARSRTGIQHPRPAGRLRRQPLLPHFDSLDLTASCVGAFVILDHCPRVLPALAASAFPAKRPRSLELCFGRLVGTRQLALQLVLGDRSDDIGDRTVLCQRGADDVSDMLGLDDTDSDSPDATQGQRINVFAAEAEKMLDISLVEASFRLVGATVVGE